MLFILNELCKYKYRLESPLLHLYNSVCLTCTFLHPAARGENLRRQPILHALSRLNRTSRSLPSPAPSPSHFGTMVLALENL